MAMMEHHRVRRTSLAPTDALVDRHLGQVYDPTLMEYRPQRSSMISSKDSIAWDTTDFILSESRPESRRSSLSSNVSFGTAPSIYSQTNATSVGSRTSSFTTVQQRARSTLPPPPVFQRLPTEIYDCILRQLRQLHYEQHSQSCATCYARDLYNLALTSRAWDRSVRVRLYDRIHIAGAESPVQVKKYKLKSGIRLKLLRRTLRERQYLAQYVHELKVPNLPSESGSFNDETINIVASVVMACPNLEKLVGFYPIYNHEFDRLTYALSTRRKLKEHLWIIGENEAITERSLNQLPPGLMDMEQARQFLQYHEFWSSLTTLVIQSQPNAILEHDIFISMFESLSSLQHLSISSFDVDDFNNDTLQYVPALQSLRLQNLAGVTDAGLSRFASAPVAQDINRLSLINIEIASLLVISKLLAYLTKLTRFTFAQESSPTLPPNAFNFQPIIASPSLQFIHWDIISPTGPATQNLAASIVANGFPALHTIRAPSDPNGSLQALCRPRAQIVLPSDKYSTSSTALRVSAPDAYKRTLHAARQAAQCRIDEARKTVSFKVMVEEEGQVSQIYDFNGFIGSIGSSISYVLRPDVLGSEEAVAAVADVRESRREVEAKDGCTGLWNASHHAGKKWWWHVERYRWREVELDRFF